LAGSTIGLAPGYLSSFGNITGPTDTDLETNITAGSGLLGIAFGTTIENAIGGSGRDWLLGNDVANTLYGGTGAGVKDTLYGYGGADTFVCSLSDAVTDLSLADTITDFVNGTDRIGLEDRAFTDLGWANSSGNTKIFDTGSNKVLFVLSAFDYTLIDSTDFIVTDFV